MKTTKTGFRYNPNLPFFCNAIKKISDSGASVLQKLTFVSVSEPCAQHESELKCDFVLLDEFGTQHEVSEDFTWQH